MATARRALSVVGEKNPRTTATGVDLDELLGGKRDIEVEFPSGKCIKLTYDPSVITLRLFEVDDKDPEQITRVLCKVIRRWDLAIAGVGVTLDPETLAAKIPAGILGACLKAIYEDTRIDPQEGTR